MRPQICWLSNICGYDWKSALNRSITQTLSIQSALSASLSPVPLYELEERQTYLKINGLQSKKKRLDPIKLMLYFILKCQ